MFTQLTTVKSHLPIDRLDTGDDRLLTAQVECKPARVYVRAVAVALNLMLFGCAQTRQFTPSPAPVHVQLAGLPRAGIQVQVNDLRGDKDHSDRLADVLNAQVTSALSTTGPRSETRRNQLVIDIIEHRAYVTIGNWDASTRLRARLTGPGGNALGHWEAKGSGRRSNMWGYATAAAVAQDSYNIAIADLFSALSSVSIK